MRVSSIRLITRALALLFTASLLTTCGDDSSSSKDDRGVFGEMADVLMQAETDYLTANAEVFASAEYMEPFIAALLEIDSPGAGRPVQRTCLPAGMGGRTYTINGAPFTSVVDTAVPEYTARFLLFRLSAAGQPLLNQEIGIVDYSCSDVESTLTEIRVLSGTIPVASVTYSLANDRLSGEFGEADGSSSLAFGSLHDDVEVLRIKFLFEGGPCDFHFPVSGSGTRSGGAQVTRHHGVWDRRELQMGFEADAYDSIVTGFCSYVDSTQSYISACIESGTVAEPIFSSPSTHCYGGYDLMSVNDAQLQAMSDSYQSLRVFWLKVASLSEICRSLVPSSTN